MANVTSVSLIAREPALKQGKQMEGGGLKIKPNLRRKLLLEPLQILENGLTPLHFCRITRFRTRGIHNKLHRKFM